jgi:hypothetical protein
VLLGLDSHVFFFHRPSSNLEKVKVGRLACRHNFCGVSIS